MCPICIISAIVLGTSAASAGGIHWLTAKLRGKQGGAFGSECQLFPQGAPDTESTPANPACDRPDGPAAAKA